MAVGVLKARGMDSARTLVEKSFGNFVRRKRLGPAQVCLAREGRDAFFGTFPDFSLDPSVGRSMCRSVDVFLVFVFRGTVS